MCEVEGDDTTVSKGLLKSIVTDGRFKLKIVSYSHRHECTSSSHL